MPTADPANDLRASLLRSGARDLNELSDTRLGVDRYFVCVGLGERPSARSLGLWEPPPELEPTLEVRSGDAVWLLWLFDREYSSEWEHGLLCNELAALWGGVNAWALALPPEPDQMVVRSDRLYNPDQLHRDARKARAAANPPAS